MPLRAFAQVEAAQYCKEKQVQKAVDLLEVMIYIGGGGRGSYRESFPTMISLCSLKMLCIAR